MRPIDADATKEKLGFAIEPFIGSADDEIRNDTLLKAISVVESMPTVDAQPVKHGTWIVHGIYARCSECEETGWTILNGDEPEPMLTKFCPNCGAKMRKVAVRWEVKA